MWYQQQGAEDDIILWAIGQEVREHPQGSLDMYVERLEAQMSHQPANPNLWSTLFPLYREAGQTDNAVTALERLIELEGRQPSLLAQLAQLRFFMAERELTDEVQALVDEVRDADPRQPTVLGILGIHAFDQGITPRLLTAGGVPWPTLKTLTSPRRFAKGLKRRRRVSAIATIIKPQRRPAPGYGSACRLILSWRVRLTVMIKSLSWPAI